MFKLESSKKRSEAGSSLNDRGVRAITVSVLLLVVVLLSAVSGLYAGASFFPQQAPNVTITTTIYTTTTSWTTSTLWSTVTSVVQGVLTTVVYTTSTSTITVTGTSSLIGTRITPSVTGKVGSVTVTAYLRDVDTNRLANKPMRLLIDGQYVTTLNTTSIGYFYYSGAGPTSHGTHTVTLIFDGDSTYAPSQASQLYTI